MGQVLEFKAPERRCTLCGEPAGEIELFLGEEHVAQIVGCRACVDETERELAQVRPVFEAMITVGVDREIANDAMTYLLNRMHPPKLRTPE